MWIKAFECAQKLVYRYSIFISLILCFQPLHLFLTELLKGGTDMVASYYHVVPYLQRCYALLATSNAAHNY